ncbi:MAG: esterase family protein [Lentisphaeria bacterium]|nr:esterase family protein [Lentisphaeria bacterium]
MAFMECRFFSDSLGMSVTANVLLPQRTSAQIGLKGADDADGAPVLYLLHGLSDDESIWMRRTSIERYATQYGLAVVMPNGGRSYYADMFHGGKYWTYLSEELPNVMQSFFRFSTKREDTFAAGLSMGGYGAMKLALHCPERFAAAASLSGALDPLHLLELMPSRKDEFECMFGDLNRFPGSFNDLFAQAERCAREKRVLPKLFLTCGTEDSLYSDTTRFRDHLQKLGIPFAYDECKGTHEWGLWDRKIQEVIRFLPRRKRDR